MKFIILLTILSTSILCLDPAIQDLVTPLLQLGEACGYGSCSVPKEDSLNVHIVPYSHAVLGQERTFYQYFTGTHRTLPKVNVNVKRILDSTITELWANENRRFVFSDMVYFFEWWSKRDPTVRRMVYQLLRQGRLQFAGGGWSMSDESTTTYHAIIDHYTYTLRKINATFLECGRPLVTWQADVFGNTREFASLASLMGFDGHFIGRISYDDELNRMKEKNMEFVWRGSDDLGAETDIFTHKLFDGYWPPPGFCFSELCDDPLLIDSDTVFKNVEERAKAFTDSVLYRQAPYYTTQNIMVIMGKKMGYHDAAMWFANIDKLITNVNKLSYEKGHKVWAFYSTPACYLKAVHNANPTLKTKQDDFIPFAFDTDTYAVGMYSSRPTIKYLAREGHIYFQIAKQLQVIAKLSNYNKAYEESMWILGAFQDHNVITGAMAEHIRNDYIKKMYNAIQRSTLVIRDGLNYLRGAKENWMYYRCRFNISFCDDTSLIPRYLLLVYNPLGWPVTIPIRVPVVEAVEYLVFDSKGDQVNAVKVQLPKPVIDIPQRNTTSEHELVFIAEDLPPLGFRGYLVEFKWIRRNKRSLIKKINRRKKYFIRQANASKSYEKIYLNEPKDYYDYDYNEQLLKDTGEISFNNGTKYNDSKADEENKKNKFDSENEDLAAIPEMNYARTMLNIDEDKDNKALNYKDEFNNFIENFEHITEIQKKKYDVEMDFDEPENALSGRDKDGLEPVEFTTEYLKDATVEGIIEDTIATTEGTTNIAMESTTEQVDIKTTMIHPHRTVPRYKPEDLFIENKYVRINLKKTGEIDNIKLSNDVTMSLDIQFYYYESYDPSEIDNDNQVKPGPYIFRAFSNPIHIKDNTFETAIIKTELVEEIHVTTSNYTSYSVRLYAEKPVIEIDWLVGPVPINDNLGKEVNVRYKTDLVNNGVYYTDSNSRQTIKRVRNKKAYFQAKGRDPVAGNFYPVTSKIHIEDTKKNIRFAVFNDRTQGAACLEDGVIDFLIHRRVLTSDDNKADVQLNETDEFNQGIVVRGKHYLYLTKANHKQNKLFEKKFAKEIFLAPQVLVQFYQTNERREDILNVKNEFSALKRKLPFGVHLLTLEKWNGETILLRLENYLEKSDVLRDGVKTVNLKEMFVDIEIKAIKETTLAANMWLKDWVPLKWNIDTEFYRNFNDYFNGNRTEHAEEEDLKEIEDVDLDDGVVLKPQQIRTFVVWYDYK